MQTENLRTNSEQEDSMLDIQETLNPNPDLDVHSSTHNPGEEEEYFNHTARKEDLINEGQKSAKKSVSFAEPESSFISPVPEDTSQDPFLDTSLVLSDKKEQSVQKVHNSCDSFAQEIQVEDESSNPARSRSEGARSGHHQGRPREDRRQEGPWGHRHRR